MDARCRVELFGVIRVLREDGAVSHFRTRKAAHLLACLALPPGHGETREVLVDRFWPDLDMEQGRDGLSGALSMLRKILEPPGVTPGAVLVADRLSARLDPAFVTTDVQECEELLSRVARTPDPLRRVGLLSHAVALYQGPLAADCYDDWVLPEQRRWAERHVDALLAWSQALDEVGDLEQALDVATRAAAADPLREQVCAARIRLYAGLGRHADARECYRDYERRLKDDSGVAPPAALGALLEELRTEATSRVGAAARLPSHAGPPALPEPSPLRTVEVRLPPLPPARSRMFGRGKELARLLGLLSDVELRLVTVTGPGGAGKTRLAVEAARRMAERLSGRVAFVPLESVDQPERIAGMLVRALGLPCGPDELPEECAAEALGSSACLLVLDNFEQLLARSGPSDARSVVGQLLTLMPELRLLVTSRQALAVEGERELRLAPLSTPARSGMGCESVELFVDRARAIDPAFGLTEANKDAVRALCDRLEGLPLAIEMAAAWTRVLPPGLVLERLQRQPTDLSARRQDAPLRHRSLRATLAWSYELLPSELRAVFAALSVFRGGWDLEGAEAVVGECALEALADLAERSLVLVEEDGRYRYLVTVREYASERLRERETDERQARERHARFFVRQAEDGVVRAVARQAGRWADLAREYPNLHAALEWLEEGGHAQELARVVALLERFWLEGGYHLHDGAAWTDRALALYDERDAVRAALLVVGGRIAFTLDRFGTARELYGEGLALAREGHDTHGIVIAGTGLARSSSEAGDLAPARAVAAECVEVSRALSDPAERADALKHVIGMMRALGDPRHEDLLRELAALARSQGLTQELPHALFGLALLARDRGETEVARQLWEECVAVDEAEGTRGGGALWGLGMLAESCDDTAMAVRWYSRSLRENLAIANHTAVSDGLQTMAEKLRAGAHPDVAARLLGAALRERLGAEPCEELLQEGWRMEPEAAIELALQSLCA